MKAMEAEAILLEQSTPLTPYNYARDHSTKLKLHGKHATKSTLMFIMHLNVPATAGLYVQWHIFGFHIMSHTYRHKIQCHGTSLFPLCG
jgi:hypothetical protein